jgi:hypothetical protein
MSWVEGRFKEAAKRLLLCELTGDDGHTRVVEPYMIYESQLGQRMFHCYQVGGHSQSGQPKNWKNLPIANIKTVQITGKPFRVRRDYNPANQSHFPKIHFAVPKVASGKPS